MNRISIMIANVLIFIAVLGLKIYLYKRKIKKAICNEKNIEK